MKKVRNIFIFLFILSLIAIASYVVYLDYSTAPFITSIERSESKRYQDKVIINVHVGNEFYKLDKSTWCFISKDKSKPSENDSGWTKAVNGYCNFTVEAGEYEIYVKDKHGNINSIDTQNVKIDKIVQIKPKKSVYYLYKGQKDKID